MAHTDRDDARWFWKDHFRYDSGARKHCRKWDGVGSVCWCDTLPEAREWVHPYRYEFGLPSWWNRDCRREERGQARNKMNRARAGHIDWDELVIDYRRPYYW